MNTDRLQERSDRFGTLANRLPYGFIASIAEYGQQAMGDWLKKNAPEDVAELFDLLLCLEIEADVRLRGKESQVVDSSLLEYVAKVARISNNLGVTWRGADGGEILLRGANEPPAADDDEEETDKAVEPVAA